MRKLGCLVIVLIAVAAGWMLRGRLGGTGPRAPAPAAAAGPEWEPLTAAGAQRARRAIEQLGHTGGPVYATVGAGDVAAYLFQELARQLPPSAQDVRAAVIDDRMYVRASVQLTDLGGAEVLGPLAGLLAERDTLQFGGTFEVLRPGLAQFRIRDIRLREFAVPARVVPRLVGRIRRGPLPAGVAADALPVATPPYLAEVRIGRGRITMYKNVP